MATTTRKTAKKPAKKVAKRAGKKTGKKSAPTLKQLVARTQKIHADLTQLLALMRRMGGGGNAGVVTRCEAISAAELDLELGQGLRPAVLPIDLDRDEIVLIRQFRLGAHLALGKVDLVEVPAGRHRIVFRFAPFALDHLRNAHKLVTHRPE
mgnify:CR=1 FL=1